jgi:hypothetical protein
VEEELAQAVGEGGDAGAAEEESAGDSWRAEYHETYYGAGGGGEHNVQVFY